MRQLARLIESGRIVYLLAFLGCLPRLFHYLRDPSIWHDEAALIVNVLNKDFVALLGPLRWDEAAPPLFLWLERAIALTLGDSTYALRLMPVLASCAAMFLFAATVRKLLSGWPAFWAMLLFATSDRLCWHAAEAKPYAIDVFVACAALFIAVRLQHWAIERRLALLICASPVAIFISYPSCFVCGALLLYLLAEAWVAGWRARLLYSCWAGALVCSFAILCLGPIRAQHTTVIDGCWQGHFPNWSQSWYVPIWSLGVVADVFRYCFKPIGNLLASCGIVGFIWLWRSGHRRTLLLLVGPALLAFFAALLHRYPFGGSRLEVFLAPALALLLGAGVEPVRKWLRARWQWGALGTHVLLATPPALALWFAIEPWPRADAAGAAEYVLAHRKADDAVSANHWEYVYLFRHAPGALLLTDGDLNCPSRRLWVVHTDPDKHSRKHFVAALSERANIVERKEFTFTSVALLDLMAEPAGNLAFGKKPALVE